MFAYAMPKKLISWKYLKIHHSPHSWVEINIGQPSNCFVLRFITRNSWFSSMRIRLAEGLSPRGL